MNRISVGSDIALLPFSLRGKQSQLVLGMDIGITHRNLLESYFPFIDDRYVWLRHTSDGVDVAVSAFCFTSQRRVLTDFEEVALLLISKQATLALQRAILLDQSHVGHDSSEFHVFDFNGGGNPTARTDLTGKMPIGASGPDIVSGAIAHDLRSHITLLGIELKKLKSSSTSGHSFPNLSWERIAGDLALLSSLTKDLAEYSCANELLNSPSTVPLSELFCLLQQRFLRSNDRRIEIYCYKPPQIRVPQRYMEIVLGNLIHNAIDSIGPQRRGNITVNGKLFMGTLILEVSDNGIGLKAGELDRLFTPSLKAPSSDPEKISARGTGLGLTIVKHLVNRAGGRIRVQSTYERGTKFTLHFPLRPSQA
jgi:two-component sensor histidine kinase